MSAPSSRCRITVAFIPQSSWLTTPVQIAHDRPVVPVQHFHLNAGALLKAGDHASLGKAIQETKHHQPDEWAQGWLFLQPVANKTATSSAASEATLTIFSGLSDMFYTALPS